jgi:hypothetical protein
VQKLWYSGIRSVPYQKGKNVKKPKLSLCLTNQTLRHEYVWGNGCINPRILELCTSWRWVVSFTSRSQYPRRKSPRYPLDRRLDGHQNRSGRRGKEKNLWHYRDSNSDPSVIQPVASRYTHCSIPARPNQKVPWVKRPKRETYYTSLYITRLSVWIAVCIEFGPLSSNETAVDVRSPSGYSSRLRSMGQNIVI